MHIEIAGENSLIVYFSDTASPEVSGKIQRTALLLEELLKDHLVDLVPSYASLLIIYNQFTTDHFFVQKCISHALDNNADDTQQEGSLIELPAYYSEESGADLLQLARNASLSVEQVIDIHTSTEYRVYAIGFAPGFAYLGEVDERIAAPRLSTPRLKVPKGAIAIADRQTAVYPAVSPGGWNLIGLCPTPMFDQNAQPSMPVQVGDRIKFKAIDRSEFIQLGGTL